MIEEIASLALTPSFQSVQGICLDAGDVLSVATVVDRDRPSHDLMVANGFSLFLAPFKIPSTANLEWSEGIRYLCIHHVWERCQSVDGPLQGIRVRPCLPISWTVEPRNFVGLLTTLLVTLLLILKDTYLAFCGLPIGLQKAMQSSHLTHHSISLFCLYLILHDFFVAVVVCLFVCFIFCCILVLFFPPQPLPRLLSVRFAL